MAKAKSTEMITLINTGVAVVSINKERFLPNEEMEVSTDLLDAQSIRSLIFRGELSIKDNADLVRQIKSEMAERHKPDPTAGKTTKQLEDGGEI